MARVVSRSGRRVTEAEARAVEKDTLSRDSAIGAERARPRMEAFNAYDDDDDDDNDEE